MLQGLEVKALYPSTLSLFHAFSSFMLAPWPSVTFVLLKIYKWNMQLINSCVRYTQVACSLFAATKQQSVRFRLDSCSVPSSQN
jgi:hypothetical protein